MKHNTIPQLGASLLVALGLSGAASAAFINGNIDFSGKVTLNTESLATATTVTEFSSTKVLDSDGDFALFAPANTLATITSPWSFSSGTVAPFWQAGGFTFDLISSWVVPPQTTTFLQIEGVGTVRGNGFDKTSGTWAFSINNSSGKRRPDMTFTFSASSAGLGVPDGGTTTALFGISLLGLYGARRKFGKV